MLELLKNIFAIKKAFLDSSNLYFYPNESRVEVDGEELTLEMLKDIQTQTEYINRTLKNMIHILEFNEKEIN